MHSITDQSGYKLTANLDIAKQFVSYFSKLYNLPKTDPTTIDPSRNQIITEFLKQYSPSPISDTMAQDLDSPLTDIEAKLTLKQMKPGKTSYSRPFSPPTTPSLTR